MFLERFLSVFVHVCAFVGFLRSDAAVVEGTPPPAGQLTLENAYRGVVDVTVATRSAFALTRSISAELQAEVWDSGEKPAVVS